MLAHVLTSEEEGTYRTWVALLGVTQRKGCVDDGSWGARARARRGHGGLYEC